MTAPTPPGDIEVCGRFRDWGAAVTESKIRATHPYSFRSGQWAELLTIAPAPDRDCYVVQFPDGVTDWWVVNDPAAGYEFR